MTNLTNGDDTYSGTDGDDIINGRGGNDTIYGLGGDDQINGGSGNDTIDGGSGDDQISGGSGDDILIGGLGDDILIGGSGDDTVVINAMGAQGIGSHNGGTLTVTTDADGQDELTGVEHIKFLNGTVDIVNGNANAYLGADTLEVSQGTAPIAPPGGNVLSNDFDIDDTMTLTGFTAGTGSSATGSFGQALHGEYGSLTLNADGSYTYAVDGSTQSLGAGEHATDVFTYFVHSGGSDFSQTITITIDGANDAPIIDSSATTLEYNDTSGDDSSSIVAQSGTLVAHDIDDNDPTLTYGIAGGSAVSGHGEFDVAASSTYGTLYMDSANGNWEFDPNDAAIEGLKSGSGTSFTFTVYDGHGGFAEQNIDIDISATNDTPTFNPISTMNFYDTSGDDSSTIVAQSGTLSASDRDTGDTLTFSADDALSGTFSGSNGGNFDHEVSGTYGTLYFNSSTGAYEFDPNDSAIEALKSDASESFSFTVTDGSGATATQTLTIDLHGVNDTPVVTINDPSNGLVEAGTGVPGTSSATASVDFTDRDSGDTPGIDASAMESHGWNTSDGGLTFTETGTYGEATYDVSGHSITYHLDDGFSATQALNTSDNVQDTFTIWGTDNTAGSSASVSFDISGSNDAASISGTTSGTAEEAGGDHNSTPGYGASGTLTVQDVDNSATFQCVSGSCSDNGYGTYSIDSSGHWTFTVNEDNSTVQALNVGSPALTDHFTVLSADGTSQVITILIDGQNDAACITGDTQSCITESGIIHGGQGGGQGPAAANEIFGQLFSNDVDNDSLFRTGSGSSDHGYGTYTVDASGDWSYTLNDHNATVNALNDGQTLTDCFTVLTTDGTEQVVTIVINGSNEIYNGTNGADVMRGSINGDTMTGFGGNDTYFVNNCFDKVVEQANDGYDTVHATVSYTLSANVEALLLDGHGDINGAGNCLDNAIVGNAGANVLVGLDGDDSLQGGNGSDVLDGGNGDDILNGGVGNDTASYADACSGVTVDLTLTGFQNTIGAGNDKLVSIENLTGSNYCDTLTGNLSGNVITGLGGADILTGGGGHDTFVYTSACDSNIITGVDTITDLTSADSIDLSALGNDFTIVKNFDHLHCDEITLKFDGANTTISIDLNGDGTADMQILVNGDHHGFHNFIGLGP